MKKIFGERLRKLREEKNEPQTTVCKVISVGNTQLSEIENGRKATSLEKIVLLALHFGVTTDYLLGLSDDPKKSKAHKAGTDPETILGERNGKTTE